MEEDGGQPGQITHSPGADSWPGCDGASAPQTQSVSHLPTSAAETPETASDIRRCGEPVIRELVFAFFFFFPADAEKTDVI